VKKKTDVLM